MAEQYLDPSTGEIHSSFAEQMLSVSQSHSSNVAAVTSSYYMNVSQSGASPAFEPQTYQETDASQQFLSAETIEGSSQGASANPMETLTKSAFELLQDVVAQASSSYDKSQRNSTDRNQQVSLLPLSHSKSSGDASLTGQNISHNPKNPNTLSASTGPTIVVDANSMTKTNVSVGSTLPQKQANVGSGANANTKIIKIVPQKTNSGHTSTQKPNNGQPPTTNYRCVFVKDPNGTQKNCIVIKPATSAATDAPKVSQTNSAASSRAMKLANSVEREIMDMISATSANFTIKGEDAKKSGLLEKTTDKNVANNSVTTMFFCVACKEKYAQKEGFHLHFQRISFVLKYKCTKCATVFTFFNKCALWLHLTSHSEDIDYQRVLRLDPYDFASNPNVFTAEMNASVASNSKEIMTKVMSNTQGIVKCPICQEFVRNLPIHLKRPDGKHRANFCYICEINLPSKCSFLAHERLHRGCGNPICCPECGLTREAISSTCSLKDVFDHVDACMHFNRAESFSCNCKVSFTSPTEAKKHFLQTHMKSLSKCLVCSVAFTDPKLLSAHLLRSPRCQAQAQIVGRPTTKVTCLCTLCKSILTTEKEAVLHLQKHVSNESEPAWICFLCSMMFSTANELRIHCEEDHPHKAKRCTICFKLFCNRQLLVDHIIKKSCNMSGQHSLGRCADMPPKAVIDIDGIIKNLYKVPDITTSQSSVSQGSPRKSLSTPSISINIQEQQGSSSIHQEQGCESQHESDHVVSATPASRVSKVAIRKPASLDNTTSALLDEIQQWMSKDGKEIVPTATPPSRKKGRPKKEKRPPPHLVCCVTAKGISYQCHPCKIIVTGTSNFVTHMKYHEAKGDCSYGAFCHCSVCDKLIGSHLIMKHLKDHQDKGVLVCIRCQRRDFSDHEDAIQHAHNLCNYKKIGGGAEPIQTKNIRCENVTNNNNISVDSAPRQSEIELEEDPCLEPEEVTVETPTEKAVAPQAKNKLYPCHLCSLVFENVVLRDQHVRKSHGGTRKIFHCLACEKKKIVKTFTTSMAARKHVTNKHRVVQRSLVERFLKEVSASVSSSTSNTEEAPPAPQDEPDVEGPTPKRLRLAHEGDFLCGTCGFSCAGDDRPTFNEHIKTHNLKKEPQCPECGLCYTVLNAVKRHLFAVHKIKNVDSYLAENGILEEQEEDDEFESVLEEMLPGVRSLPPVTRPQQSPGSAKSRKDQPEDDLDSLECNVCYRSFDTEANLKTHMRTHGMAFIRSKRYKPI
ncbi:hypothetical protein EGW08_007760 [Elysia chlorotica]|uniref:C2H2-type domain-containing protein n=1 Tax=Elysia chlorotica TaxID=188477 RepID=A0A433TSB5_ELYCH|nr:hypothetical protein EGW08_007760 [Elysia chlorotica]